MLAHCYKQRKEFDNSLKCLKQMLVLAWKTERWEAEVQCY